MPSPEISLSVECTQARLKWMCVCGVFQSCKKLHKVAQSFARWFGTAKNQDESTGPLTCPFARSLAPLARLLVRLHRSLTHSQAHGKVGFFMSQNMALSNHSAVAQRIHCNGLSALGNLPSAMTDQVTGSHCTMVKNSL